MGKKKGKELETPLREEVSKESILFHNSSSIKY